MDPLGSKVPSAPQPIVVVSDPAAWEAQSISGEGMTPKKTVAAAQIRPAPTTSQQRPAPRIEPLVAASASGDAPAMAGMPPTGWVGLGSGRIQTAATTRR